MMDNKYDNDVVRREYVHFILAFNKDQFSMIEYGRMLGLTIDQINMYAHPDIDNHSMRTIIDCIMNGMTDNQIKVIANPKLKNLGKVTQAVIGFKQGLTVDQVSTYAKPEYTVAQMISMRTNLVNNEGE